MAFGHKLELKEFLSIKKGVHALFFKVINKFLKESQCGLPIARLSQEESHGNQFKGYAPTFVSLCPGDSTPPAFYPSLAKLLVALYRPA